MKINLVLSPELTLSRDSTDISFPGIYDNIVSPFFNNPVLTLDNIEREGSYWPIACLGSELGGILFFLIKDNSNSLVCWVLDKEGVYVSQSIQSVHLASRLIRTFITQEQVLQIKSRCSEPFKASISWVTPRLESLVNNHFANSTQDISSFAALDKSNPSSSLLCANLSSVNLGIDSLRSWLRDSYCDLYTVIIETWKLLASTLYSHPPSSMIPAFEQGRYCLLREIASMYIGRHVIKDPFNSGYLLSFGNKLIKRENGDGFYRVIEYKSSQDLTMLEVRGLGFLMQTDSIYFSSGLMWLPTIVESESSWLRGEPRGNNSALGKALIQSFQSLANTTKTSFKASIIRVLNNSSSGNLGHTIWNDMNGYCSLVDWLSSEVAVPKSKIEIILPHQEKSSFSSGPSYTSIFNPLVYELAEERSISSLEIYSISELDEASYTDIGEILYVSVKGWNITPEIANRFKSKLIRHPSSSSSLSVNEFCDFPSKLKLFINVRGHNKSLININDCMLALIEKLSIYLNPATDLSICLEGSHHSISHIESLVAILAPVSYRVTTMIDEPIPALAKAISNCDLSIMPIGSGAVVSTWICSTPTILHGDYHHRAQKGFWGSVSGSSSNAFFLPESIFTDETSHMYSSYRIEPNAFADEVSSHLMHAIMA